MPVTIQSDDSFILTDQEVERLWKYTREATSFADDEVTVRCVSEVEIKGLNRQYRQQAKPTNVLTFSYDNEHDVALCLPVAEQEAMEREVALRDYVALLLVHAFLHATGMDHEESPAAESETQELEKKILAQTGFTEFALD